MKEVTGQIKLQLAAGKATPAPPVGPALGQHGVNIPMFCKEFNARTQKQDGMIIPVVISVYKDRSFTFVTKTPPASVLLKREAGLKISGKPGSGSGRPNKDKVGTVTRDQLMKLAEEKIKDMNAGSLEAAARTLAGTARSMGIEVAD